MEAFIGSVGSADEAPNRLSTKNGGRQCLQPVRGGESEVAPHAGPLSSPVSLTFAVLH